MKSNGLPKLQSSRVIYIAFLIFFFHGSLLAQPDYYFENKTLVSGTDLQIGAVYRYHDVKPGIDALVTITDITTGITVSEMDGSSGYPEALQPTLQVQAHTKGYLEMNIEFVIGGTDIPMIQLLISPTCIDVDGVKDYDGANGGLYEFDEMNLGGGLMDFDLMGGELTASQTGDWFVGKNIGGVDYPARDTGAHQVMFTATNFLISSFIIRVGVDNQSNNAGNRLRSVYFRRFFYANSFLALPALASFNGRSNGSTVELQWKLATPKEVKGIIIEKAAQPGLFSPLTEIMNQQGAATGKFEDNKNLSNTNYYRLKMLLASGEIQYSNILVFRIAQSKNAGFKIYPSVTNSNTTLSINSVKNEESQLQLFDMNGRTVRQEKLNIQEGTNNISIGNLDKLSRGTYIAVIKLNNSTLSQRIVLQ